MPQTEIAKARLESKYKLKNLLVIPNAVNLSVVVLKVILMCKSMINLFSII